MLVMVAVASFSRATPPPMPSPPTPPLAPAPPIAVLLDQRAVAERDTAAVAKMPPPMPAPPALPLALLLMMLLEATFSVAC